MTAFAWIIALIALGVATWAIIFARRAAESAGDPVAPGPVADDPHDEARLSAVFAALPVASVRVDAGARLRLRTALTPVPQRNFLRAFAAAERHNSGAVGADINSDNSALVRFKNGGYGGTGGCVPHRNHAVIPAVRRDD